MSLHSYSPRNVVAAALLAVLAATLTLVYVSSARTRSTTPVQPVHVLVAARDVPVGTTGAQLAQGGWLRRAEVAHADVAPGAVTSRSQLAGLVATQAVYTGEQLTTRRLGTAGRQGLRSSLHGTLRIVELPGDAHQLLAGTLRDGDHVDVVASVRPETGIRHFARVVLRNLLVVDAAADPGSGGGIQGRPDAAIRLQLTDAQEQRLFWVQKNADWTLALRPSGNAASTVTAPMSAETVLAGPDAR